jgi:hypothetical protein
MVSKRERTLMIVILGIVGSYGLFLVVRGLFVGPLETQASQIRSLRNEIASKSKQVEDAQSAVKQLAEWEKLSLPGDEGAAQALYQDYLFKLMRDCHFEEPQVSADKTQKAKSYTSIPFTIRGRVSLENLTEFLYRFHACDSRVLHQVRTLSIARTDTKSKSLSVTIILAALALDNAPHRGALIPDGEDPRSLTIADVAMDTFQVIAKKNIFEPFTEPTKEPDKPQVDAARHVVFSGCTQSGDEPEAWIYDRLTNENRFLRAGDEFAMAGLKGRIVSVAASNIVIEMDDKQWSLKLGKNLRELKEIGRVASAGNSPASDKPADSKESPDTSGAKSNEQTSAEKADKMSPTIPVTKDTARPVSEVTKAAGGI